MDMNALIQLISGVGFPIAVSLYLLYDSRENQKAHKEESINFVKAIDNNTAALKELAIRTGSLEEAVEKGGDNA